MDDTAISQNQQNPQSQQNTPLSPGVAQPVNSQPAQDIPQNGVVPPMSPQPGSPIIGNTQSTPIPASPQQPPQPVYPDPSVVGASPQQPIPQAGDLFPGSSQPLMPTPTNPALNENLQGSSVSGEDAPKITLEDLYGPSTLPGASQSQPVQQTPSTPNIPPMPEASQPLQEVSQNRPVLQSSSETTIPQNVPAASISPSENSGGLSTPTLSSLPPDRTRDAAFQPEESSETVATDDDSQDSGDAPGGFHFPPFLKFIVGGVVLLLVVLLAVSFIGSLFNKPSSGKVMLSYWGLWEDKNVMSGVISDFERTHPNVTVDYIEQDPKQYTQRLLTRINNGSGPDIFRFHNSWVTPLSSVLLPLPQSVLNKSTLQSDYPPVISQDLVKNGALLGLPLEVDTLSLIVNKDIFTHAGAKVPTSWDDFITVSKALTVKDPSGKIKTAGAAMGTFANIDHAPDIVSLLLLQNGANLQKLDKSQNTVDALSFYTSFAGGTDNVWDSTLDNSLTAFERGNLAMYFGYSWDVLAIKAASPNLNIAVYDVPHLAGRNMTVASYWAEGISSKTTHPKEAAEFLQFLAQKDTQTKLYSDEAKARSFGEIYARQDLAQTLTSNSLLSPFVDQAKNAVSSFFIDQTGYDEFNGTLNTYLGNAVASILSNTSIDTATTTLAQGVTQVFNRYVPQTQ